MFINGNELLEAATDPQSCLIGQLLPSPKQTFYITSSLIAEANNLDISEARPILHHAQVNLKKGVQTFSSP